MACNIYDKYTYLKSLDSPEDAYCDESYYFQACPTSIL